MWVVEARPEREERKMPKQGISHSTAYLYDVTAHGLLPDHPTAHPRLPADPVVHNLRQKQVLVVSTRYDSCFPLTFWTVSCCGSTILYAVMLVPPCLNSSISTIFFQR